jgi:hypothetical protein
MQKLLDDAVSHGRLVKCDTTRLAFALHAIIGGSMVAWGVLREGTAEAAMQQAVETLLAPYLASPPRGRRSRGTGTSTRTRARR